MAKGKISKIIELHFVFSMVYQEQFKNKIKNIEAQIGEILIIFMFLKKRAYARNL